MTDGQVLRKRCGISPGLLLVLAVSLVVFFSGIGRTPLWDEDETRFASVARAMIETGDWIVPRFSGELADKPAGLFWMIAGSFIAFGETPASARICSAICGLMTVAMVWSLGVRLFGKSTALWGSLASGTSLLFAVEARAATADAALLAVITGMMMLATGSWWKSGSFVPVAWSRSTAFSVGFLAGAGILLKGLVALLVPYAAFFLFYWWASTPRVGLGTGRLRGGVAAFFALRPAIVVSAAAFVCLPWHVAVGLRTGGEWLELFYWKHHLGRAVTVMEGHGGIPFLQLPLLMVGMFPWAVFLPLAVWRMGGLATSHSDGHSAAAKLMISWSAVWLLLFSLTATQLPNYVLPAYPALGLCVGHLLACALERPESVRNRWFYAACAGLLFGAAVFAGAFWALSVLFSARGLIGLTVLALVPLFAAAGLAAAVAVGRRKIGACIFTAASVILLLALFLVAAPEVGALDPIAPLIERADVAANSRARLGTWRFGAPGVVWSADRPVIVCPSAAAAAEFLECAPGKAFLLVDELAFGELAAAMHGELEIVAEGQPLSRRKKVLLVGAK